MLLSVQHLRVTLAVGDGVLVACLEKDQRVILGWGNREEPVQNPGGIGQFRLSCLDLFLDCGV